MAHRQLPGERLEARPLHLVEVADGAVHDRPHAADRPHDRAVHFAQGCPGRMRPVEVLHDQDLRARLLAHVAPVFGPGARMLLGMVGVARLDHHRHGVADHRPHLGHEVGERLAADSLPRRVVGRDLLPAVVDRGRIEAAEFQQGGLIELRVAGGGNGHRCLRRGEWFANMICHLSKTCQPRDAAGVRGLSVPTVRHSRLSRASLISCPENLGQRTRTSPGP